MHQNTPPPPLPKHTHINDCLSFTNIISTLRGRHDDRTPGSVLLLRTDCVLRSVFISVDALRKTCESASGRLKILASRWKTSRNVAPCQPSLAAQKYEGVSVLCLFL